MNNTNNTNNTNNKHKPDDPIERKFFNDLSNFSHTHKDFNGRIYTLY